MKTELSQYSPRECAEMRFLAAGRASFLCERKEAKESWGLACILKLCIYICISFNNQNRGATCIKTGRKIMNNENLNQIIQSAIENGTAENLTLASVESLIGKRIITKYFGYRGQDGVDSFVVDKVVPAHTLWGNQDPAYHAKKSSESPREYGVLELLGTDNHRTFMRCYPDEGLFWCSDSDRFVKFVIAE